jgi:hypothetical protein
MRYLDIYMPILNSNSENVLDIQGQRDHVKLLDKEMVDRRNLTLKGYISARSIARNHCTQN